MENASERKTDRENLSKFAYVDFLKDNLLFSDFSDESLNKVLLNSSVKKYEKDQLLFLTGDKADFFYIVISGWVKLFRETHDGHESVISVLTHGDMFGKTAILKNGSFPYNVQIISDAILLLIPAAFILEMANDHKHFDDFLAKFLESQINETHRCYLEFEHLAHMTSAQRVGCFLLKMCGSQRDGSITLILPYEKSLVAGKLGMTPETFSRALNQLSPIGVETKNTSVTIHHIGQLRSQICGHCSAIIKECSFSDDEDF